MSVYARSLALPGPATAERAWGESMRIVERRWATELTGQGQEVQWGGVVVCVCVLRVDGTWHADGAR
eukprot:1516046-Prymnesium_polylepis.1